MAQPKQLLKGFARTVATTKPDPKKRITLFDPEQQGLAIRITPKGSRTYTVVARDPNGRQIWAAIGNADLYDIGEARNRAREAIRRIKEGVPAVDKPAPIEAPDSFAAVFENFLERYIKRQGLRSAGEIERSFRKYILPPWKNPACSSKT